MNCPIEEISVSKCGRRKFIAIVAGLFASTSFSVKALSQEVGYFQLFDYLVDAYKKIRILADTIDRIRLRKVLLKFVQDLEETLSQKREISDLLINGADIEKLNEKLVALSDKLLEVSDSFTRIRFELRLVNDDLGNRAANELLDTLSTRKSWVRRMQDNIKIDNKIGKEERQRFAEDVRNSSINLEKCLQKAAAIISEL